MKNESVIAIILGVILGGTVGFFILQKTDNPAGKDVQQRKQEDLTKKAQANKSSEKPVSFTLSEPAPNTTVSQESIVLKGKATKDSLLIIMSPAGNKIIKLEKDEFSVPFDLALGENIINITYYPAGVKSEYIEKQVKIFYLN